MVKWVKYMRIIKLKVEKKLKREPRKLLRKYEGLKLRNRKGERRSYSSKYSEANRKGTKILSKTTNISS